MVTDLVARPVDVEADGSSPDMLTPPLGTVADAGTAPLPSRGNRLRMLVAGFAMTVFAAMWCNAILDLLQTGGDAAWFFTYTLDEARFIFFISSALVWAILLAVIAVTGRLFVSVGLVTAAALVIGFASYQKIELRQEPIFPADLSFAGEVGFLGSMLGPAPIFVVTASAVLIVLICVLFGRIASRVYPPIRRRTEPRLWRRTLLVRVLVLSLAAGTFGYASQFNEPGNKLYAGYNSAGAEWAFWFQKFNYQRHGFVAGFLYNLQGPAMLEPEGYGEEAMSRITAKYENVAEQTNAQRSPTALSEVNVVVVLSETFTDPTLIEGPVLAEDPIPFTRSLMKETRSGTMLAQMFGGGTANMEFEALTGMSLSQFLPQMNSPYQMLVPRTSSFPSTVGLFRHHGHTPVGVHPYMPSMYKRHAVYPTLGFSEFVDGSKLQDAELIDDNPFVADAVAFQEVEQQIAKSDKPAFVNLVTMQNHYPMAEKYDDPIDASGVSGDLKDHLTHYARGLKHSDDALRDFITGLEASDEKTAVIFYGDHAPAFWSGDVYERNGDDAFRRTPYFMWTNFQELPKAQEPITSPIYFLPTLFNDLDAPLPPYYALLTELQREIPAMEQGEYFLPSGEKVTEEELPPRARELLEDYRLVQYDLAVGERYAQNEMFYPESGD